MCDKCEAQAGQAKAVNFGQSASATTEQAPKAPMMIVSGVTRVQIAPIADLKSAIELAARVNMVTEAEIQSLSLEAAGINGMLAQGALGDWDGSNDSEALLSGAISNMLAVTLCLAAKHGISAAELFTGIGSIYQQKVNVEVRSAMEQELRERGLVDYPITA